MRGLATAFAAAGYGVELPRMRLVRSFHVATLDYEKPELEAAAIAFAARVTAS
jgi:hypothetical protein